MLRGMRAGLVLLLGMTGLAAEAKAAPAGAVEAGVPFVREEGRRSLIKPDGQEVELSGGAVAVDRLFLLGMTNSMDRGAPGWMTPMGNRAARFFLGTRIGGIEIEYADGAVERVPLIFGYDVWWYGTFAAGYVTPLDTAKSKRLVDRCVRLEATGEKPPRAFVVSVKLRGKPVKRIRVMDEAKKEGAPVIAGVTLHRVAGGWEGLRAAGDPVELGGGGLPGWDAARAIDPEAAEREAGEAVDALRKVLYTSAADVERLGAVPVEIPKGYPEGAPRVRFKGDLAADLLSNEYYANVADTLVKTEGGRYRTSSPGAANYGRYTGIGTWREGVGWNQERAWSRDFGAALVEVAALGFQDRAERLADYAYRWARWYPEHQVKYADGTATPAHWTRVIDQPESLQHNGVRQGCAENDGHGLLMLGTYQVYRRAEDKAAWARQRWGDIEAAAEWICWQFEHPGISGATRVLNTWSEASRPGRTSIYADFMCSEGLRAYAEMAEAAGHGEAAKRWRERAAAMEAAELEEYPAADPKYGRIWRNNVTWGGRYPMLGPLITLADRRGLKESMGEEWDRLNEASYLYELHEHAPEDPAWHMAASGYGQCFVTEAALLLDRMAEATELVEVLAKLSYSPGPHPYVIPEGVEWTDDHKYWYRTSDLGNGVQQANFLKVVRLLVGVDDARPESARILPRLPLTWSEMSVSDYPMVTKAGVVRVSMEYRRPRPGRVECEIRAGAALAGLAVRLGPFAESVRAEGIEVKAGGRGVAFDLERRGGEAWVWVRQGEPANAIQLTAEVRPGNGG